MRQAGDREKILSQHLLPQPVDLIYFGKEPVPSDVEVITLVTLRASEPPDLVRQLELALLALRRGGLGDDLGHRLVVLERVRDGHLELLAHEGRQLVFADAGDVFFFERLDFFRCCIAFGRDDEMLLASGTMRLFSTVLIGKANDRTAIRTVELDRHLLYFA